MAWVEALYARRRDEAEARAARVPEIALRAWVATLPPPRDLAAVLGGRLAPAVIAEVKFASPSQGVIRAQKDVEVVAAGYARAGAAALSVLTDAEHFGGELTFLARAREASGLPVLRKDFLVAPYEVVESRAAGADAVLLIARYLERPELAELLETAREMGMATLVELHGEEDLEKVTGLPLSLVGVNHRDLETLALDMTLSERMVSHLPDCAVRVAESGLASGADLRHMAQLGYQAVLVGTAFMASPEPGGALASLLEECHGPR